MPKKKTTRARGSARSTDLADILFPNADHLAIEDGILEIPPDQRRLHTETVDYNVHTIVGALNDGSIVIPEFQRRYVWTNSQASRLIESLIIQCPIPVVYLSQGDDEIYKVIDGNQRLNSLKSFLNNEFSLSGLTAYPELDGNFFKDLDPRFQRHIVNRTIRCLIILKDTHPQVKFDVFERLNSGAVKLTPQEVRHGIHYGDAIKLAEKCAKNREFQRMVPISNNKRMKLEELIIRFWALSRDYKKYKKPLSGFLNAFCDSNRHLSSSEQKALITEFEDTVTATSETFGDLAFTVFDSDLEVYSKFNAALYDCQMVGINLLLKDDPLFMMGRRVAEKRMLELFEDESFVSSFSKATSDEKNVKNRISTFIHMFGT